MKYLRPVVSLLLACGAALAAAADGEVDYFAICETEVRLRYTDAVEVKLVSLRRRGSIVSVKVAVRQLAETVDMEKVAFTSCQVSRELAVAAPAATPGSPAEGAGSPP
jgi:hypothetical protein